MAGDHQENLPDAPVNEEIPNEEMQYDDIDDWHLEQIQPASITGAEVHNIILTQLISCGKRYYICLFIKE